MSAAESFALRVGRRRTVSGFMGRNGTARLGIAGWLAFRRTRADVLVQFHQGVGHRRVAGRIGDFRPNRYLGGARFWPKRRFAALRRVGTARPLAVNGHSLPGLDRRWAVHDIQAPRLQVRLVDLPADGHLAVFAGLRRQFQHRRLRIDQHAQARSADGRRPRLARTVGRADGEPELAVTPGAKGELSLVGRRLGILSPVRAAVGRNVQLRLDRLPRGIAGALDAEGYGEQRLPRGVQFRQRRRGGSRSGAHLRDHRHAEEPSGERLKPHGWISPFQEE